MTTRAAFRSAALAPFLIAMLAGCENARIAVVWDTEDGAAFAGIIGARTPRAFEGPAFLVETDSNLAVYGDTLYVLGRSAGTIKVIDTRTGNTSEIAALGEGSGPVDMVVLDGGLAYVSRRTATRLLRINLQSGDMEEVIDLSVFADPDGVPDMHRMITFEGRLFVQIQRANEDAPNGLAPPAYLAVIDLATEQLVDADPGTPGVQAVELEGTAPKMPMQVIPGQRRLYLSATGGFFDQGGIEAIDLDTLQSLGLVIREVDGETGADLGAFVFVTPERGYLVFSTDLDLSSHLLPFSLSGGVEPGPEMHVSVGYFVPSLAFDPRARQLFVPDGAFTSRGVHIFDTTTNQRVGPGPIAITGRPTDIIVLN